MNSKTPANGLFMAVGDSGGPQQGTGGGASSGASTMVRLLSLMFKESLFIEEVLASKELSFEVAEVGKNLQGKLWEDLVPPEDKDLNCSSMRSFKENLGLEVDVCFGRTSFTSPDDSNIANGTSDVPCFT